jgi:hypothetical protein
VDGQGPPTGREPNRGPDCSGKSYARPAKLSTVFLDGPTGLRHLQDDMTATPLRLRAPVSGLWNFFGKFFSDCLGRAI